LDLISYIQPSNPQYNTLSLTTLFRSQKYSKQTQTILFTCLQGNLRYSKGNWNRNGTILRLRKSLLKTRFTNESRTVKPLKQSSRPLIMGWNILSISIKGKLYAKTSSALLKSRLNVSHVTIPKELIITSCLSRRSWKL